MAAKPKTAPRTATTANSKGKADTATPAAMSTLFETGRATAERQFQAGCHLIAGNTNRMNTTMMNNMNGATAANTEIFEAYTQYCQTWAKGCEDVAKSYATFTQSLMQDLASCWQSSLSAKSVQDAVSMQSDFVRQQFDKAMSESTRISETLVKVASDAAEPLQTQWTSTVSRYSKAA